MLMILALSTNDQQDMFDHSVNALLKENLHAVLDLIHQLTDFQWVEKLAGTGRPAAF
jgi:hypothetical protein